MENTQNDSLPFVTLSRGEAKQVFSDIAADLISKLLPKEPDTQVSDTANIDDAIDYLNSLGYLITKNSLYNLTASKSIPFRKIGRRVVFSRSELSTWVAKKTTSGSPVDTSIILAESARRKR